MSELTQEAIDALHKGRIIEAIKITRLATGLGLKEAKEQVEGYLRTHPDIKVQMPQMSQEASFRLTIVLIAIAVMVWFFFKH